MTKEALRLAKDLVDPRKVVSLEAALQTLFLADDMLEDRFMITSTALWNGTETIHMHKENKQTRERKRREKRNCAYPIFSDEIVENILDHIISTGDLKDFSSASLVCKQFFVTLQRRFIWYDLLFFIFILLLFLFITAPPSSYISPNCQIPLVPAFPLDATVEEC